MSLVELVSVAPTVVQIDGQDVTVIEFASLGVQGPPGSGGSGGGGAVDSVAGRTGEVVLTKADVGLGNVDNTSDVAKPVSTATQTALDAKADAAATTAALALKAPLASPALTGTPSAPTAATATNSTQLATTAFVQAVVAALIASAPGALDTLDELAAAFGDDPNFAATVTTALAGKQPLDATLTALAGLAGGADKLAYFIGTDVLAQADLTAFGRSVIALANAGALRAALNVADGATAYTDENARDAIGAALAGTANRLTVTVNDGADTIALDIADEGIQDIIGAMVVAAGGTYDDAAGAITLPGGGGLTDGDKGDIVVSGGGTGMTIEADAVTYSKMQNVSDTARVLGRKTAGAGDVEELTGPDLNTALGIALDADVQIFGTAGSFTWTKPTGAKRVHVQVWGGGGGGGSGAVQAAANGSSGGGGGGGGAWAEGWFDAVSLGTTETVTVGGGGFFGSSRPSGATSAGFGGGAGGASAFGSKLRANGGANGSGGGVAANAGGGLGAGVGSAVGTTGAGISNTGFGGGGGGSANQAAAGSAAGHAMYGGAGGGGGGGKNAANAVFAGATGGRSGTLTTGELATPAAGASGGPNAGGTLAYSAVNPHGGYGGGGGGASHTTKAGDGGAGQQPGGGGGGGGGGTSTTGAGASGAGGAGGAGLVVVTTFF